MVQQIASDVPNKPNYQCWIGPHYTASQFVRLTSLEQLRHLCHLAHLAPSTHNTQPWRFFIDPASLVITIFLDRRAILPASDPVGRQAVISVGCAIRNMCIGAKELGLSAVVQFLVDKPDIVAQKGSGSGKEHPQHIPVARLIFTLSSSAMNSQKKLYPHIFKRKMVRAEFDPARPLPPDLIRRLHVVTDGKATRLHDITDPVRKLAIAEFQAQADGFVINSKKFSRELGEWLLPNDTSSYVGMPGIGFGLQDVQARRIHEGLSAMQPLEPEDGLRFSLAGKMGIEKSPFVGCITVLKDDPVHWLKTGMALEEMFLVLESEGVSVAMHAGIVEVALVNRIFATTLGTLRRLEGLFRAGFVREANVRMRPHSPRLPLEKVLMNKNTIESALKL